MQSSTAFRQAESCTAEIRATQRPRLNLTTGQLQQLGMFRVAYLTGVRSDTGVKIVIHSADGMAVAMVDSLPLAVDLASQLGLSLVAVH